MQKVVLSEVVDYLHKAYPDASIGVGGSVASGTYTADSDVDILFQREGFQKDFLISFFCKGIKVSIFGIGKNGLLQRERNILLNYRNMPISFISSVAVIYDDKELIVDLKSFVRDMVERRRILRYILIDELKVNIRNQLQLAPTSYLETKKKVYAIIDKMISLFYLKFHAGRIVQKQEGRNPYTVIKNDDYMLYEKLKESLPYCSETYYQVKDVFENYIQNMY